MRNVPSENQIMKSIKKIIFGERICCFHCRSRNLIWYEREKRWFCRRCRKKFSLKSICWMRNMKISYLSLYELLSCWQKRLNIQQTSKETHISEHSVISWYDKFRKNLKPMKILLKGNIEIDEIYLGRNKGAFGALERETGRIVLWAPKYRPDKAYAHVFLDSAIDSESNIYTDKSIFYRDVKRWGFKSHYSENHSKFEFGLTSRIEGIWGIFRTFIRRMYHHIRKRNLEKYMTEFQVRFCQREIFINPYTYLKNSLSYVPT